MRKPCLFLLILFTLLCNGSAFANTLFQEANSFYRQDRLQDAFKLYLKIYLEGKNNPALLYNAGTSALKSYNLSKSSVELAYAQYFLSLAYFKSPLDEDIYYNLKLVNQVIEEETLHPFFSWLSGPQIWRLGLHLIFFIFSIHLFFTVLKKTILLKKLNLILLIVYVSTFLICLSLYIVKSTPMEEKIAVIKTTQGTVYSEPIQNSTKLATLIHGHRLNVLQKNEDWLKIQFNSSRVGWIKIKNTLFFENLE